MMLATTPVTCPRGPRRSTVLPLSLNGGENHGRMDNVCAMRSMAPLGAGRLFLIGEDYRGILFADIGGSGRAQSRSSRKISPLRHRRRSMHSGPDVARVWQTIGRSVASWVRGLAPQIGQHIGDRWAFMLLRVLSSTVTAPRAAAPNIRQR